MNFLWQNLEILSIIFPVVVVLAILPIAYKYNSRIISVVAAVIISIAPSIAISHYYPIQAGLAGNKYTLLFNNPTDGWLTTYNKNAAGKNYFLQAVHFCTQDKTFAGCDHLLAADSIIKAKNSEIENKK